MGNCYINRNQIGAIVGSQPFGGEGLSGTGPKAGGPNYLKNLLKPESHVSHWEPTKPVTESTLLAAWSELQDRFTPTEHQLKLACPGVTGESNRLYEGARGYWLAAGDQQCWQQAIAAAGAGNPTLVLCTESSPEPIDASLPIYHLAQELSVDLLPSLAGLAGVSLSANVETVRAARKALLNDTGAILPLLTDSAESPRHYREQHICEDTTAAGGNAALMMGQAS